MDKNIVYASIPILEPNDIKRNLFFFDRLIILPMHIQGGLAFNSPELSTQRIIELFEKDALKIDIESEKVEDLVGRRLLRDMDIELKSYLIDNAERISTFSKLSSAEKDLIKNLAEEDYKNIQETSRLNSLRLELFSDEVAEILISEFGKSFTTNSLLKRKFLKDKPFLKKKYKQISINTLPEKDRQIRYEDYYECLIQQRKVASLSYSNKFDYLFLARKFKKENIFAKDFLDIYDEALKLDIPKIESFSMQQVIEIRESKYWSGAMKELKRLVDQFKIGEDKKDNISQLKSDIKNNFFDCVEETNLKKVLTNSSKDIISTFTLGKIPILGETLAIGESIKTLIDYLKNKDQRNLVYFIKELRNRV